MIWVVIIGFFAGIISGMGIGGGAILIPAITMVLDVTQHEAQGINLLFFLPTAIVAVIIHNKSGRIEWGISKKISIYGIIGAIAGSILAINLEALILKRVFGVFLILMGAKEILFKKNNVD